MNTITLGVRNAFRNATRSLSIVIILGLSIGLSLVMLIAHQAVGQKIADVKQSIGNTVTIQPAGFSAFSDANNALTSSQLAKVKTLAHVTSLDETLTDRLTTIGSATSFNFSKFGSSSDSSSNNQTSLKSPVQLNVNGSGPSGGEHIFINGGGSLPSNFMPPVSIVGTTSPLSVNGTTFTMSSGSEIDGSKDTANAMISTNMASKNNLKVGSTFTAYGTTLTVGGIFHSTTQGGDNDVIVSLPTEQRLSGQAGDVTSATATVDSVDNLSSATSAIENALGSSADVTNSQDQVNQTIQPLNNVRNISLYSLIGAVIAGSVIILLTMIMIVRERRREIGILKAIGGSNLRIIFQFMSEALTFTVLGAIIGLIIGVAGGNPVTNTLVKNSNNSSTGSNTSPLARGGFGGKFVGGGNGFALKRDLGINAANSSLNNIKANVGWSVLAWGLGAAVMIAAVGSSFAGWLIARVRPSEVMRLE